MVDAYWRFLNVKILMYYRCISYDIPYQFRKKSPRYFFLLSAIYVTSRKLGFIAKRVEYTESRIYSSASRAMRSTVAPTVTQLDWHRSVSYQYNNAAAFGNRHTSRAAGDSRTHLSPFRGQNTWGTRYRNKFFPRANPDAKRDPTIHF